MTLLSIKDLNKNFGGLEAVKNLDIEIHPGEIVGLIGPNGAGKTTLFNLISGFFKPDQGEIFFKNKSLINLKPHQICKMGVSRTYQIVRPFMNLTVLMNVILGRYVRNNELKSAENEALHWLEFVNLLEKKDTLTKNLTLADRRKVELARVLATEPELLLLDETMSGLTPKETSEMTNLINRVRESGITLFIIEHIMKAIMSLSDRIFVLNYGKKIAEGSPQEITRDKEVIKSYLGEEFKNA